MSSDDDETVLQKHKASVGTSLARTKVRGQAEQNDNRRQSKESQSSRLSYSAAGSRQTREQPPARKAAATATAIDDSDDDAHLLGKHSNKLLSVPKVCGRPCAEPTPQVQSTT